MLLSRAALAQRWEAEARIARTAALVMFDGVGPYDAYANRSRTAVTGALALRRFIVSHVALQVEIAHARKGYTRTQPTLDLSYVELPVLTRLHFGGKRTALRPYVLGGIAPALLLRCSVSYTTAAALYRNTCRRKDSNGFVGPLSNWDIGALFAIGVEGLVGPGRVVLDARYTRGLRDIDANPSSTERTLNLVAALSLGYSLPLTRPR